MPFGELPETCVIKVNHASGRNIIKTGEIDIEEARAKLSEWLQDNYYWHAREFHYSHIRPRIMVERHLGKGHTEELLDYRFWCFDGVPQIIQIDNRTHDIDPFFDVEWNMLPIRFRPNSRQPPIARPRNLAQMLHVAARLSSGIDFVRVDLYNVDGRIYFGELTFTPAAGRFRPQPDEWDARLGSKWNFTASRQFGSDGPT